MPPAPPPDFEPDEPAPLPAHGPVVPGAQAQAALLVRALVVAAKRPADLRKALADPALHYELHVVAQALHSAGGPAAAHQANAALADTLSRLASQLDRAWCRRCAAEPAPTDEACQAWWQGLHQVLQTIAGPA